MSYNNNNCICDECGNHVDDSWGDPRVKVYRYDFKDSKEPSSFRMICQDCKYDLFTDHEPHSIFG